MVLTRRIFVSLYINIFSAAPSDSKQEHKKYVSKV